MKQHLALMVAAFGLLSLNPVFAQSTATVEHAGDHGSNIYRQGEPIRIEFSAGDKWSNKPLNYVAVDFVPEHQDDSGFRIACELPMTVSATGLVNCNTKLVDQLITGRYHIRDVMFVPHGTLGKVLLLNSEPILVDGLDRELQELLDHTQLSDPQISPQRIAGTTISGNTTLSGRVTIQ